MFFARRKFPGQITTALIATTLMLICFSTGARAQAPIFTPQPPGSPFKVDGTIDFNDAAGIDDPDGNVQELGPVNSADTKINPINTADPPMLDFTNPNGQVDLGRVWIRTGKDTRQGRNDDWLYLAWHRPDSNSGSGVIGYEFFKDSPDATLCNYNNVDFVKPKGNAAPQAPAQNLIDNCNPWRIRQHGDFFINWDQEGNTLELADITMRTFTCSPVGAADPEDPPICVLGAPTTFSAADVGAALSGDRFRGEMVINLTTTVFAGQGCTTLAGVIPNTITGNSDTADYKDTVFTRIAPISNCGILQVIKKLVDSQNNPFVPDPTKPAPVFHYKVYRGTGDNTVALRFDSDLSDHPDDPNTSYVEDTKFQIERDIVATDSDGHTHSDLIIGTDYKIEETTVDPAYTLLKIVCFDGSSQNGKQVYTPGTGTPPGPPTILPFDVKVPVANGFQLTVCEITNQRRATTPDAASVQNVKVVISDTIMLTNLQIDVNVTPAATARFRLYDDATCADATVPLYDGQRNLDYSGNSATASTPDISITVPLDGTPKTFKWRVNYPGDLLNNAREISCGDERAIFDIELIE
jgi:hypothetical protein